MQNNLAVTQKRKPWLDLCRLLALFWVIFAHAFRGSKHWFFSLTSPIKLPLFFILSGYLFSAKHEPKEFFKRLFFRIAVPWLIWGTLELCIADKVFTGSVNVPNVLLRLISAKAVGWYIPCLLVSETIFYTMSRVLKRYLWVGVAVCTVYGVISGFYVNLEFARVNVACTAQSFLFMGFLIRQYEDKLLAFFKNNATIMGAIALYLVMALIDGTVFPKSSIDMNSNRYNFYPLTAGMAFLGTLILFKLTQSLKKIPDVLVFLGQNTLLIYILEAFVRGALKVVGGKLHCWYPASVAFTLLQVVIVFVTLGGLCWLLNKKAPWLNGK